MCGILAIARSRPADTPLISERALGRAMERLARRGPDARGIYESPDHRTLLAHTRLAIQDLSPAGRQPMADDPDQPRVVVTYNGEIYNAPSLRQELERLGVPFRSRTDTEVLVHGFTRWGFRGLLDRLRGMFALVLLDQRELATPALYAAVDHVGMKPLAWWFDAGAGGRLAIASDCDALLAALSDDRTFQPRLDGQALAHILSLGYCPAPWTMWRGVRKLGPGQMFTWRVGTSAPPMIERHWSPPETLAAEIPNDAQDGLESLLRTVVDEHLLSDVPVGLFLSAGIDSSAIALALAQSGHADDVTACTLSPRGEGGAGVDPAIDESPAAAALCRAMMMRHRVNPFDPADVQDTLALAADAFDEPQGFTALLTATRIARCTRLGGPDARPGPSVVLAGDGGDEAFAGYPWHFASAHPLSLHDFREPLSPSARATTDRLASPDCDPAARAAAGLSLAGRSFTHRYLRRVFPGFHPAESRSLLAALEPEYDDDVFASWLAEDDRPQLPHPRRAQRLDLFGFCAGSILPKIDRSAMSVALELRSPLLDRRILEWSLARPVDTLETGATTSKPSLRAMLSRGVAAGLLPPQVLSRPKQGFSLKLPAKDTFQLLATATLPDTRLIRDGVIRRDWARFLPRDTDAREIRTFTLCMLAAWYERRAV